MTPEQLMQDRYEVIELWLGSESQVGDIISIPDKKWMYNKYEYCLADYFNTWPHLFRRLHWSEKRNMADMPKYLLRERGKRIFKVGKYDLDKMIFEIDGRDWPEPLGLYLPATPADYEAQQKGGEG